MKTKIIPFDAKIAKDIQEGKIEGKIKTSTGYNARIICWDRKDDYAGQIIALYDDRNRELLLYCNTNGKDAYSSHDLVLEVPDNEPQFKPFDKVLVRENDGQVWHCDFYSYTDSVHGMHYCIGHSGSKILPYEGNEHLVGTTDKPE